MGLFDLFKRKKAELSKPEQQPAVVADILAERTLEDTPVEAPARPNMPDAGGMPQAQEKQLGLPPAVPQVPQQSSLRTALNRTRAFLATAFTTDVSALADDDFYDELTEGFILADVGAELASELAGRVRQDMVAGGLVRKSDAQRVTQRVIARLLTDVKPVEALQPGKLSVLLVVGVNGSGKTTLSAKLAHRLRSDGLSVLLCAADTFRAAAVEQLRIWAQRAGVEIVAGQEGADPAAVVFDAASAAQSRVVDVLIVDTAGRLQTKANLMAELAKIARTVEKAAPGASITHLLVLDATVGQNALSQARLFNQAAPLSGLALTKVDGTAKGGAILAAVAELRIPVLYLGIGEGMGDLLDFDPAEFAASLVTNP